LEAELAASHQKKGKSSQVVTPRLNTGEQGQIMLTLTPQLLADIFEEFPIVQQAYAENVPKPASIRSCCSLSHSHFSTARRGGILGKVFQLEVV